MYTKLVTACFLLVNIVVVRVVAPQCDERAQAEPVGEEDLSCGIQPHLSRQQMRERAPIFTSVRSRVKKLDVCRTVYLGADELIEVGGDVEADPVDGSGQGDPAEEQDEQHEVGIGG